MTGDVMAPWPLVDKKKRVVKSRGVVASASNTATTRTVDFSSENKVVPVTREVFNSSHEEEEEGGYGDVRVNRNDGNHLDDASGWKDDGKGACCSIA